MNTQPHRSAIPWFWSDQFDWNIQLLGSYIDCNETVSLPQSGAGQSVSLYLRDGQIVGAVGINSGRNMRLLKRLLDSGRPIDPYVLAKSGHSLQEALKP
jgi:Reductase C-terminal